MKMKYFQAIADIRNHYDEILKSAKRGSRFDWVLLETWNVSPEDIPAIQEERDALAYLIACQNTFARDKTAMKPSVEVVNRLFNRHLAFLADIFDCDASTFRKYDLPGVRKEYEACSHYLFQFSLPAWVEKMPAEIPTFEGKHERKVANGVS